MKEMNDYQKRLRLQSASIKWFIKDNLADYRIIKFVKPIVKGEKSDDF